MFFNENIDYIGKPVIKEVYLYYDMELIFSCKNQYEELFFVLTIDFDKNHISWLYAPISEQQLELVEKSKVLLYDVFKNVENNYCYILNCDKERIKVKPILSSEISDTILPDKDVYLD